MSGRGVRRLFRPWPVAFLTGMILAFGWVWNRGDDGAREADQGPLGPIRAAQADAIREARAIAVRLHRDAWIRDLVPRVVADHRSSPTLSPTLSMGWPDGRELSPARQDSITAVLSQPDLRRLSDEDVAIGLHAVEASRPLGMCPSWVELLGVHDGTPYCVRITTAGGSTGPAQFLRWARTRHLRPDAFHLDSPYRTDLLGGCTFVRRFGMPGEHIRAWLGAQGSGSREGVGLRSGGYVAPSVDGRAGDALNVGTILTGEFLDGGVHVVRRSCRSGDRDACMREFFPGGTQPEPPPESSAQTTVVAVDQPMFVTGLDGDLRSRLEAEFGSEAFAAFWTSDAPLERAFESAFGLHPADWVYRTATDLDGPLRAGPAPGTGAMGTSVLLMLAGLAVGTLAAIRRRTE